MTTPGNAGSWAGGWDEPGVLSVVLVNAGTPGSGVFIYSGVPAFGNLVESETAQSGTDPLGNAYLAGHTYYAQLAGGFARGAINYAGTAGGGLIPEVFTASTAAGPYVANGNGIFLSAGAAQPWVFGGSINANDPANSPGTFSAEQWHSLGTLTGYTVNNARYRMTPTGEVEFDINVTSGGANAATTTFSNTLGSAYLPPALSHTYPLATNVAAGNPRLGITTLGAVTISLTANTAAAVVGGAFMPIDS